MDKEPINRAAEEERGFYQLEESPAFQENVEKLLNRDPVRAEGSPLERLILRILNNIKAVYKKAETMAANIGKPGGAAALDESGKVPAEQLPAMDYVPNDEKGTANGVATLGENGRIPNDQFPETLDIDNTIRANRFVGTSPTSTLGVNRVDASVVCVNGGKVIGIASPPIDDADAANKKYVDDAVRPKADASALTAHTGNKANPHGVTAAQVGALPLSGGNMTGHVWMNQNQLLDVGWITINKPDNLPAGLNMGYSEIVNLATPEDGSSAATKDYVDRQIAGRVPTSHTVNGKSLDFDVSLKATDAGALPTTGGTVNGDVVINTNNSSAGLSPALKLKTPNAYVTLESGSGGALFLSSNRAGNLVPIKNVEAPTDGNDAVNKNYVDTAINGRVPTSRTVNGKALSSNISLTASDVSALPTSGGTITGNLTLKGSGNYGNKINFGDGNYVYLQEPTDDDLVIRAKRIFARTISCRDDLKKLGQEDLQDYIFPQFGIYVGNGQSTNNIAIFTNRSASKPRAILIEGIGSVSSNTVSVSGYTGRRQGNYSTSSGTPILGGLFVAGIKYTNSNGQSVEFVDSWLKLTNIAGEYLNVNGRYYAYVVF